MTDTAQAAATVTITLSRDDAQELFDNLDASLDSWEYTEGETIPYLERCRDVFKAALDAAPPSAPSELEQAIAECEAKGLKPSLDQEFAIEGRPSWRALVRDNPNEGIGAFGFTPFEALYKAIANYERGAK